MFSPGAIVYKLSLAHDQIPPLVYLAVPLLAARVIGVDCVSDCLAPSPSIPIAGRGRFRSARLGLGHRDTAGSLASKAKSETRLIFPFDVEM